MSTFRTMPEAEARTLLRHQLVGPVECDEVAAGCALLRSCLWALSGGRTPVHVLRLMNLATSLDSSDKEVRARIRENLDELADAGDLVELANGRWLPAPIREVSLGTGDDARLFVGGLPTSILPPQISSRLEHTGAFRRTKGEFLAKELELPVEALESWMGEAPEDLEGWTKSAFEGKFEICRDEARYFHFYAPELYQATTPQAFRWAERSDKLSGRYLCRQELPFGLTRYYAGEVVVGKLTRFMSLHVGDLRRLMYGLDLAAGKPVAVEEGNVGDEVTFILKSELPKPERRLFAAMGRVTFPEGNYYPRTWHFKSDYAGEVRGKLSALGIRVSARARK